MDYFVRSVPSAYCVSGYMVTAMARLTSQLTKDRQPPSYSHLEGVVRSENARLFFALDRPVDRRDPWLYLPEEAFLGTATAVFYDLPIGGRKGWIEDVIVDDPHRGQGIGEALTRAATASLLNIGASVNLTSMPERGAANRFYQRLDFKPRRTNVYRYEP